jgi:ParB/RepB/Spo0J family partition protein
MAVAALEPTLETGQSIEELPLSAIVPAPDNPRKQLGDVDELAASMVELGMLQPLVVTPRKGKFMVVCGHRRHAAAKVAKLGTAPVIVRELDEPQRIKAMLIENCQRTDLTALEEARAYQQLVELGLGQRQIAGDVGKSQGHISKRLALLELPAIVQAELDSGGITLEDARHFAALNDMPKRAAAALKEGKRWGSRPGDFERVVRNELAEHELAETIGRNRQQLQQDGVKILEYVKDQWSGRRLPSGVAELVGINGYAYGNDQLALNPKTHAKEPCHAAAIRPRDGEIIYLCTKPANHRGETGAKSRTPDEKKAAADERAKERARALKAREKNIDLGRQLAKKFAAPKIDARNMRLLAEILVDRSAFGDRFIEQLALRGLRYTDEASQEVVTRKDGSVSKIVHANHPHDASKLLADRLDAAKTPEEIMGVLLQALIAARYADRNAVPPSQRSGHLAFIDSTYYAEDSGLKKTIETIAGPIGKAR